MAVLSPAVLNPSVPSLPSSLHQIEAKLDWATRRKRDYVRTQTDIMMHKHISKIEEDMTSKLTALEEERKLVTAMHAATAHNHHTVLRTVSLSLPLLSHRWTRAWKSCTVGASV